MHTGTRKEPLGKGYQNELSKFKLLVELCKVTVSQNCFVHDIIWSNIVKASSL